MNTAAFSQSRRSGFTLAEVLVVMGIIAILAALTVGVTVSLREKSRRQSARITIEKINTVLQRYKDRVGDWPEAIQRARALHRMVQAELWQEMGRRQMRANRAVASILAGSDDFSVRGAGAGGTGVLVRDPSEPDAYYVVDPWFEGNPPLDSNDLDEDGNTQDISPMAFVSRDASGKPIPSNFVNFAKEGHNAPGLDIWSDGPDGMNDYTFGQNPQAARNTGDDVVNWTGR